MKLDTSRGYSEACRSRRPSTTTPRFFLGICPPKCGKSLPSSTTLMGVVN
jgi:hypothetical protein